METPTLSTKSYLLAYLSLLVLIGANIGFAHIDLGWGNMFVALTIATIQASIVALFLMHGYFEKPLIRIVMGGALLWFMILVTLTMTDYITRNWLPIAGK